MARSTGTPAAAMVSAIGSYRLPASTTARQAAHRGFRALLLADATAAMAVTAPDGGVIPHDQVHRTHLASLHGFLATVTTSVALRQES